MKNVKLKLAAIVGVSVLLALTAVLSVFNWTMNRQMEERAFEALYSAANLYAGSWDSNIYLASVLYLHKEDYSLPGQGEYEYSEEEKQIAEWCRSHKELHLTSCAELGNRKYFIRMEREIYAYDEYEIIAAYIDVTAERSLIRSINMMFLLIMAVMVIGGSAAGYAIGWQIERNQAMQKKFYENMSHELKTPLTAIRGYAEGLETGIIDDTKQAAHIIGKESEKMSAGIEEILCLAKLESGAIRLNREPVEVHDFVENCLLPLEGAVKSRNLLVEIQIGDGMIFADSSQLEHALTNVLTNAIKYADRRVAVQYEGGKLVVWNDGGDLSDDDISRLFDRFYTGKGGSTGVGLALAREIVELHGWRLEARKLYGGVWFCFAMEECNEH